MTRAFPTNLELLALGAAVVLVNLSLDYGLGIAFDPWWWGIVFWLGLGVILGCVRTG